MKLKILILLAFLLIFNDIYSQETPILEKNKTFVIGLGIPIFKVRDKGHSPLMYKGISTSIYLAFENYDIDKYVSHKLIFHFGDLTPKFKPKANNPTNKVALNFLEYKYTNTNRIGDLDIGPNITSQNIGYTLSVRSDVRIYNLLANNVVGFYSSLFSIGPAYRYVHLANDRSNKIVVQGDLNLLSVAMRPNYLGTIEFSGFKPSKFEILKKFKVAPFWKDFIISTDFNTQFKHRNSFSTLGYNWYYQHNTQSQPLDMNYGGFYYNANFSR
jgi:hypothetical protein